MRIQIATLLFSIAAAACGFGSQELKSTCLEQGIMCPACNSNDDCVIFSNQCQETAGCAHRDANTAVTQEGCSVRYSLPDEECLCVNNVCLAESSIPGS